MRVSLSSLPNAHPTKVVNFQRLDGGLNLWELDYRLNENESPDMKNLWWQDGVLQCRDGQEYLVKHEGLGRGYTAFDSLFWGNAFLHIGSAIYYFDPEVSNPAMKKLMSGIPANRGVFFRYGDHLYYKNKGCFVQIRYSATGGERFSVQSMADLAYTPVTVINADPDTGSGDLYQPENRLTARRTIRYNAKTIPLSITRTLTADQTTVDLSTPLEGEVWTADDLMSVSNVYLGTTLITNTQYTFDRETKVLTFDVAPGAGTLQMTLNLGVNLYKLPLSDITAITQVTVDGVAMTEEEDYVISEGKGQVVFTHAPTVTNPPTNGTVEITYEKKDAEWRKAYDSIMNCPYAVTYGTGNDLNILLGGCEAQPNAVFWNSNDNVSMNPGYWPMSYYNLCGDTEDAVTGFGRQYSFLMVFKQHSCGKLNYTVENLDGRNSISYTYETVNSVIGCDLPHTIRLIENNLVFCNTTGGVYQIRDTSYANENNILSISKNVNGTPQRKGLLNALSKADKSKVCAFDDGNRYWVCADDEAYLWDYLLSSPSQPSWFPLDNIRAVAFFLHGETKYHLDAEGGVTIFRRTFLDYEKGIEKIYQTPTVFFDTYDRLKDVLKIIFTVRSDTDSVVDIEYNTDYERRKDLTPIKVFAWRLSPRNLLWRCLTPGNFAHVAIRKPGCRHVRHFSMRLENREPGQDLAVLSAQIFYKYLGRDR